MSSFYGLHPIIFLALLITMEMASCKTAKLVIPSKFSEQSIKMEVSGGRSKHLQFGPYKTSRIEQGWFNRSSHNGKGNFSIENMFWEFFGISRKKIITEEKDNFRFSINNGQDTFDVVAMESRVNEDMRVKTGDGNGLLGSFERPLKYQYSFSALIFDAHFPSQPWRLTLGHFYDAKADTSRKLFRIPNDQDTGFATNGRDTIIIKEIRTKKAQGQDGSDIEFPIELHAGYELRLDDGVSAIVDVVERRVWLYKELDEPTRLLLAAISASILLKRIRDVKW